jgi:Flp pilus assembly protein TadG
MTSLSVPRPLMSSSGNTRHRVAGSFQRLRNLWRTRRQRSEQGSILAMTCIFMTMFLALAGLVADGGHYFDAKEGAASEAEQAARAGASALDVSQLHEGTVALDPNTAVAQAESYMVASGQPGTAWVQGNTVYAQISYRQPTQLLGIIGVGSLQINVTESATDVSGVASGG